ncbi:putative phosphonate metabolism protein [Rhizobium leguminosarum bv. trifolii WSM2297]|uniref:Putative phosphonate metabolism protein n=1 Tax=Rhizobium leguminosarum bv. trifolii WSM2297 TaxID=754762 RepID=J0KWA2_RHILT|nr:putative phosphonate metabolism protein [Rhizobium leguminosarum bv. trifolii WSM2297]
MRFTAKSLHIALPVSTIPRIKALRYALYFSPPKDDPLTGAASLWLGRDAFAGETYPAPNHAQLDAAEQFELTADPRRYGFHATIKAPFSLAASVTEKDLLAVAEDFAARTPPFEIPELVLGQLGRFFALVPGSVHQPLQDFAAKVVRSFEPFRAALSAADMARRNPEKLSDSQRTHLQRWGYPYVMEDFGFHMTLTGQVPETRAAVMKAILTERFADFTDRPLSISGLAVFTEETRGAPFKVHSWLPLCGAKS